MARLLDSFALRLFLVLALQWTLVPQGPRLCCLIGSGCCGTTAAPAADAAPPCCCRGGHDRPTPERKPGKPSPGQPCHCGGHSDPMPPDPVSVPEPGLGPVAALPVTVVPVLATVTARPGLARDHGPPGRHARPLHRLHSVWRL
ncbi:MAG: hypothetical protein R3F30_03885 [Planctomycetota bacterium]